MQQKFLLSASRTAGTAAVCRVSNAVFVTFDKNIFPFVTVDGNEIKG